MPTAVREGETNHAVVVRIGNAADEAGGDGTVALSGLKNKVRKVEPGFSEKKLGYRSFLQFCQAAATSGAIELRWSPEADDYLLTATP
jgi:hypothetical protein